MYFLFLVRFNVVEHLCNELLLVITYVIAVITVVSSTAFKKQNKAKKPPTNHNCSLSCYRETADSANTCVLMSLLWQRVSFIDVRYSAYTTAICKRLQCFIY